VVADLCMMASKNRDMVGSSGVRDELHG